jgi:alkylation response protein AidB-like acyl-CoA dehydrogenase
MVDEDWPKKWVARAHAVQGDARRAIALASRIGPVVPVPGSGSTRRRWQVLAELSAADLTAGRVVEAHLDALAILAEAGLASDDPVLAEIGVTTESTWGVFAAEGPGVALDAEDDEGWTLSGTKPWCSLAGLLSHALVTAHTSDSRRLFAIDLRSPTVSVDVGGWRSRGLAQVVSTSIHLDRHAAVPIESDDWYLTRPGFAWGGIGVAACWYGGALGLARSMLTTAQRRVPDQIGLMLLGTADLELHRCRTSLDAAAAAIDAGELDGGAGLILAGRVRAVVAQATESLIGLAGHALGPKPLTQDDEHARRVADLTVYVRQHHAERDVAELGRAVLDAGVGW